MGDIDEARFAPGQQTAGNMTPLVSDVLMALRSTNKAVEITARTRN
jgi:hypothetical protein